MGKWNVACTHKGILYRLKDKVDSDTGHNEHESWGHYAQEHKPD